MRLMDRVRLIPRRRLSDTRGWFLKAMTAADERERQVAAGEVYITSALPGCVRGNHYHVAANEWFILLQGVAEVALRDCATGEERLLTLSAETPTTIFVPAGIAHAFRAQASGVQMLLLACTDRDYDPADTRTLELLEELGGPP